MGLLTASVMGPIERFKCVLQVQLEKGSQSVVGSTTHYTGPMDVGRQLYREGGWRSIFRGTGATFARDVPSAAFYFGTYEIIKKAFTNDKYELFLTYSITESVLNFSSMHLARTCT